MIVLFECLTRRYVRYILNNKHTSLSEPPMGVFEHMI